MSFFQLLQRALGLYDVYEERHNAPCFSLYWNGRQDAKHLVEYLEWGEEPLRRLSVTRGSLQGYGERTEVIRLRRDSTPGRDMLDYLARCKSYKEISISGSNTAKMITWLGKLLLPQKPFSCTYARWAEGVAQYTKDSTATRQLLATSALHGGSLPRSPIFCAAGVYRKRHPELKAVKERVPLERRNQLRENRSDVPFFARAHKDISEETLQFLLSYADEPSSRKSATFIPVWTADVQAQLRRLEGNEAGITPARVLDHCGADPTAYPQLNELTEQELTSILESAPPLRFVQAYDDLPDVSQLKALLGALEDGFSSLGIPPLRENEGMGRVREMLRTWVKEAAERRQWSQIPAEKKSFNLLDATKLERRYLQSLVSPQWPATRDWIRSAPTRQQALNNERQRVRDDVAVLVGCMPQALQRYLGGGFVSFAATDVPITIAGSTGEKRIQLPPGAVGWTAAILRSDVTRAVAKDFLFAGRFLSTDTAVPRSSEAVRQLVADLVDPRDFYAAAATISLQANELADKVDSYLARRPERELWETVSRWAADVALDCTRTIHDNALAACFVPWLLRAIVHCTLTGDYSEEPAAIQELVKAMCGEEYDLQLPADIQPRIYSPDVDGLAKDLLSPKLAP